MKKILLPFEVGDRVVECPRNTDLTRRGHTGTIMSIIDNLTIQVKWDDPVPLHIRPAATPSYFFQKEEVCHLCVHRLQHLSGEYCPMKWREVKSVHDTQDT